MMVPIFSMLEKGLSHFISDGGLLVWSNSLANVYIFLITCEIIVYLCLEDLSRQ